MRSLSERALSEQADELSSMIDSIRNWLSLIRLVKRSDTISEPEKFLPIIPGARQEGWITRRAVRRCFCSPL
jgi:putative heme iron utilization protein